jgi:superfamily II DNA or RNA helicase
LLRRVANSHADRIEAVSNIFKEHPKLIIFYNFDYELDMLKEWCEQNGITYGEWNGHNHDALPEGKEWVYIVQYIAGSEGWNCISTDTMVFFSQSYSYRQTEQAAGRIDRINTPYDKLYYYHLRSTASIDLAIKRSLTKKEAFNQQRFVKSIKE